MIEPLVLNDFENALRERGIIPPPGGVVADGKLRRVDAEGKNGKSDAAYILFDDHPVAGGFENWRDGRGWENWRFRGNGNGRGHSPADEEKLRARWAAARKAREEEKKKDQVKAANIARKELAAARPADPDHPYLANKKIGAHDLRIDAKGKLLIPMQDSTGDLWNLQRIDHAGEKRFMYGGRTEGVFFTVGPDPEEIVVIAEGASTALSIFEATGLPAVAAMSAGNLLAAGKAIREKFPRAHIIYFADNDYPKDGVNVGVSKATEAAKATNGLIALSSTVGDDANDLYVREGAGVVRMAVDAARAVETKKQEPEILCLETLNPKAATGVNGEDDGQFDGVGHKPATAAASRTSAPITVSDLSNDKAIPEDFLRGLGIDERPGGVLISYKMMDGSSAPQQRLRTALSVKSGSAWIKGGGSPVPYGLDRLQDAREEGFLVLVKDESDCWTLWYQGFPALGIPGATMIKTLLPEYLLGIAEIYVWREPDKAGGTFAEKITQRLREIGFTGDIFETKIVGVKDPNALHKKNSEDFKATFQATLGAAKTPPDVTALSEYIPPEQSKIARTDSGGTSADLAEQFLKARAIRPVYWRGDVYRYNGTHYAATTAGDLKADVNAFLQKSWAREEAGTQTTTEIIANIEAGALVPADVEAPALLLPSGAVPLAGPYIALADGILDVEAYLAGKTDALKPHSVEYFFLNSLPYGFSDAAEKKCKTWRRVLAENLPDPAHQNLLQEWFGLCCVQDTSFENFMLFPGEAGTGKTLTCTVLRAMLGPAAVSSVPLEAFNSSRTFPLAETVGKLANIAEEIGDIDKAAEGLLKQYVSGSLIQVERKHRDPFWLRPTARLTFATNVLPRFADRSNGVWRRMLILPFNQVVSAENRDRRLIGVKYWEASGELPGILAWALEGLRRLRERGRFEEPVECQKIREDYKRDSNPAATFLLDHCDSDFAATTSSRKLYLAYSTRVKEMGHHPLSEPIFAREVKRLFPLCEKQENATWQADGTRTRLWLGLKFHE